MSFLALPLRGYSAALTAQGLGAALSPVVGGWIAQAYGYPACFMTLGVLPVVSIVAWVVDKRAGPRITSPTPRYEAHCTYWTS